MNMIQKTADINTFFGKTYLSRIFWVALVLILGLGIRLYDITNPPLDFHPTRQLYTAIKARGLYYSWLPENNDPKREAAIQMWKAQDIEPPTVDGLTALTYLLAGKEILWVARLYTSLFWVLGAVGLFLTARELTSFDGGLIAAAVYLFIPYSVYVSRAFLPDQLMVALIIFSWYGMVKWNQSPQWKWAILAGICSGISMMVKPMAVFSLLCGFLAIVFARGIKPAIRSGQVWVMAGLSALPTLIYMYYGFFVNQSLGTQFFLRFFPNLWIDPVFYLRWMNKIDQVSGWLVFSLALLGIFFFSRGFRRNFIIWAWAGYVLYGFVFAYFFSTHDYYHITLLPVVGLSCAAFGDFVSSTLDRINPQKGTRLIILIVLMAGVFGNLWDIRTVIHKDDQRPQAQFWNDIGEKVKEKSIVALTQEYGFPLAYYGWNYATIWYYTGDIQLRELGNAPVPEFQSYFQEFAASRDMFLITDMEDYERQTDLQIYLNTHYPIIDQGEGYIIFDLKNPRP